MAATKRRTISLLATLLLFTGEGILCQEGFHQRQELFIEGSGETTYHAVVDYGPTRWFIAQEAALFPPKKPTSPFTELRSPGGPLQSTGELIRPGQTAVGFSSPWLWFGPVSLKGALAAIERPLRQAPFSGSWEKESGTSLTVGRDPPSRLGVGAAIGPVSLHHFRTEGLIRSAAILAAGDNRRRGIWGELLLSREEPAAAELREEPWFLDEPPLLAQAGSHLALRGGFNGGRVEQRLLGVFSGTRLDLSGFAAVSATTLVRRPWGWSLAVVGPNYRDGGLELVSPGISGALSRKPSVRRGHSLGGSLRTRRTGTAGAGEGRELESGAEVRWNWRPDKPGELEPRWRATAEVSREVSFPGGEKQWDLAVRVRPELRRIPLRHRDGRRKQRLALPLGWEKERYHGNESSLRRVSAALEGEVEAGAATLGAAWKVEAASGEEPRHAPKISVSLSWGESRRWQLGLRLSSAGAVRWSELKNLSNYDEVPESALFLRVRR